MLYTLVVITFQNVINPVLYNDFFVFVTYQCIKERFDILIKEIIVSAIRYNDRF